MLERSVLRWALGVCVVVLFGNSAIATAGATTVSTTPSAYPAFATSVSDYVIRGCPSSGGVSVSVTTSSGQYISVDNQPARTGTFTATANVTTGREFTLVASQEGKTNGTWYMRCLPTDFPNFSSTVTGAPQAQYFLTAAKQGSAVTDSYVTMFDDNGVPIWWHPATGTAQFATVMPNGDIAWTSQQGSSLFDGLPVQEIHLNGQSVRTFSSPDGPINFHELLPLGYGYALVIVDETKCCTDLSSWGAGFPSKATIEDPVIEELNPFNQVVARWDSLAHINPVVETNSQWYSFIQQQGSPYDVFHMNSLDYRNGAVLVSFRHLNAVYDFGAGGSILWKLGGHQDPQSLTVRNDPVFTAGGTLCGQHDARNLPDGTITVHDNGSGCSRAPRAVHYSIDTTHHTATLLGSVSDSRAPSSFCCGSARLLSGGHWVADWGGDPLLTELTSTGTPVYTVQWTDPGAFAYRVTPVPSGIYTAAELRSAMNAQYP